MKKMIKLLIPAMLLCLLLTGCAKEADNSSDPEQNDPASVSGRDVHTGPDTGNDQRQTYEPPFDSSMLSDEYIIGYDYFTGDFLENAPTVIAKIRYDGRVEVAFDYTLSNGSVYTDLVYIDLTEEQLENIRSGIDHQKLYDLDPEELDPETTCDGGYSYLIIYGKDGNVYKCCGGFCPTNKDFNDMRRIVYDNLPESFFTYCHSYKEAWSMGQNFDPYPLAGDPAFSDMYTTKYGVFLDYDGDLSALSDYDYIVIDAQYHSAYEIEAFKNSGYGKRVYSYINIGSLEDFRDYYDNFSDLTLGEYENWEGEEWIDVSDERWQSFILFELAPSLLEKGINGFFVDNCDVYYNYPTDEILDGLAFMMKALKAMGGELIINGGDTFLNAYTEKRGYWRDVITGINQECVFTSIDWDNDTLTEASDEDREYFMEYIERYADQGAYIYLLEYAEDTQENNHLKYLIKEYCKEHKFLYYISESIDLN